MLADDPTMPASKIDEFFLNAQPPRIATSDIISGPPRTTWQEADPRTVAQIPLDSLDAPRQEKLLSLMEKQHMTRKISTIDHLNKNALILGDRVIRVALVERLKGFRVAPRTIIEELRVHNGNAIADVVTVHSDTHCYEIKGENDTIQRILQQAKFYDLAFRKITLVTTARHRASAERLAPAHWGILVAREDEGSVKFAYVRAAGNNPNYNKRIALLTLWKSELAEVAGPITKEKTHKLSRESLSNLIDQLMGKEDISRHISTQLATRAFK